MFFSGRAGQLLARSLTRSSVRCSPIVFSSLCGRACARAGQVPEAGAKKKKRGGCCVVVECPCALRPAFRSGDEPQPRQRTPLLKDSRARMMLHLPQPFPLVVVAQSFFLPLVSPLCPGATPSSSSSPFPSSFRQHLQRLRSGWRSGFCGMWWGPDFAVASFILPFGASL